MRTQDETPPPVDWDALFEVWNNTPNPKTTATQATQRGENASQPAA